MLMMPIELGYPHDQVDDIRDEKLAELIIRECMKEVRDVDSMAKHDNKMAD